jgi:2-polyprenyl-3-methyl-5-hydroxy-6-metoxy-1,4-benzoquinol methylase
VTSTTATDATTAESRAAVAAQVTAFDSPDFVGATSDSSIDVDQFDDAYKARPPWDIEGPQPAFADLLDTGQITGRVLDIGCGTGENALHFASKHLDVTALDASAVAIERAQDKARQRGLNVRFILSNALALPELGETYDTITDSGLLHVLSDEQSAQLVQALHATLRPGGRYWLLCFSEHSTGNGPRKVTKQRIAALFQHDWKMHRIEAAHFQTVAGRGYEDDPTTTAARLCEIERC